MASFKSSFFKPLKQTLIAFSTRASAVEPPPSYTNPSSYVVNAFKSAANAAIRIAGSTPKQERFVKKLTIDLSDNSSNLNLDLKRIGISIRSILTQHRGEISATDIDAVERWIKLHRQLEGSDSVVEIEPTNEKIRLWQGDITRLRVGAIVNAANRQMLGCFIPMHRCIDNEIHFYAGPRLRLECEAMMREQPLEPIGSCRLTGAYLLPSSFVAHTVGPNLKDYDGVEQPKLLADCYRACLDAVKANNLRSIAFCGISTGVFHYPKQAAAIVALSAVREWLAADESNRSALDHVVFNTFDNESTAIYRQLGVK
jgi:O-acetyl-ADP-ribose deacetylase (regulator of RNase III)